MARKARLGFALFKRSIFTFRCYKETGKEAAIPLSRHKPSLVDLFCGCGGASLGFKLAGCEIVGAVDIDASACETFYRNLKVRPVVADLRKIDGGAILGTYGLKKGDVEILVGCPPCQGFSSLRRTRKRDEIDPRDNLVLIFAQRIAEISPRIIVFENVSGITQGRGKTYLEAFFKKTEKLEYKTVSGVVQAADYGVPQFRKRMISIGIREDDPSVDALSLPEPTNADPQMADELGRSPWKTVKDAIGDLPPLRHGTASPYPPNHIAIKHNPKALEIIRNIPKDGGSRSSLPKELWLPCHKDLNGAENVYGRMSWSKPGPTITSRCTTPSCGRFIHPEQDRAITPREAARLQSFPDYFTFYGTYSAIAKHIGNAMPVDLTSAIGEELVHL